MDLVEHIIAELQTAFGGKRWIVASDVLAGTVGTADWLRRLGAEKALCIGAAPGTGDPPDPEFAPDPIVFDVSAPDMMGAIRRSLDLLANLPDDAVARVDAFDPAREARVLGTIFDDGRPVAGRPKYGARPAAWQALEDKTTIDALWDAVGVPRARSVVVAAERDALMTAVSSMDEGDGTVWAADSREGFHGGATFTRWVRTPEEADATLEHFEPYADSVRVMPFLDGIPCSIHGIVFPDYVVALRPCEMLVFRKPSGEFHYGRAATFWDPPDEDRAAMRDMVRRVGALLREAVGYRGAFTIDGVMTRDGFRPTELNPRFGAALGVISRSVDLPMLLLNMAIAQNEPLDWRAADFEALLLEAADRDRSGGASAVSAVRQTETQRAALVFEGDHFRRAADDEEPDATVLLGPHASGAYLSVTFVPDRVPRGPSAAPRAVAALEWADAEWNLEIGPLEPAPDLRRA